MANKLKIILKAEDYRRFSERNGKYYIDVHGLKVYEAKSLIKNIGALMKVGDSLVVIHGYNHGTAIKDMLVTEEHLFKRAYAVIENYTNRGRTNISFSG